MRIQTLASCFRTITADRKVKCRQYRRFVFHIDFSYPTIRLVAVYNKGMALKS